MGLGPGLLPGRLSLDQGREWFRDAWGRVPEERGLDAAAILAAAAEGKVQALFLLEGTLVGAGGGALGLLCTWAVSFPGDAVARSVIEKQAHVSLEGSAFAFPWWLLVAVPAFVSLLTMLAAVYPARRAARVNPITALRHE